MVNSTVERLVDKVFSESAEELIEDRTDDKAYLRYGASKIMGASSHPPSSPDSYDTRDPDSWWA